MKHLLAAVDGSESSFAALRWAAHLAHRTDADLAVLRAWTPGQIVPHGETPAQLREGALAELDAWCKTQSLPIVPTTPVADGDPASCLLDATSRADIDLLVVGARGRGGFPRLRIGSVSRYLAQHTDTPVIVVPADE